MKVTSVVMEESIRRERRRGWLIIGGIGLLILIGLLKGDFSETWLNGARF